MVCNLLPADWSWSGKRALDFGCGAGRVMRHFMAEATEAEIWGCDIDAESVAWLQRNLCPPMHAFVVKEPPIPKPNDYFDLAWAISVFTHLTDEWSAWLLELHRLLNANGVLIATFFGEAMSERVGGGRWEEDRVGMKVVGRGNDWEGGGPSVLHSQWWIRAHWGRAFDIVNLIPPAPELGVHHSWAVLRKRIDVSPTRAELESPEPGEPREAEALRQEVMELRHEIEALRRTYEESRSWRMTRPLRELRRLTTPRTRRHHLRH